MAVALAVALTLAMAVRSSRSDTEVGFERAADTITVPAPPSTSAPSVDIASLDRVFADLERVKGDVVRRMAVSGRFTPEDAAALRAVYLQPQLALQLVAFEGLAGNLEGRVPQPPGDHRVAVTRILVGRADCAYVEATVDLSATVLDPPPPTTRFFLLRPKLANADPLRINPTPWAVAAEQGQPAAPCG